MRVKFLRVTFISIAIGVIYTVIEGILNYFVHIQIYSSDTNAQENVLAAENLILIFIALALFVCAGIFFFKDMTKKEIAKSSLIVCGYNLILTFFASTIFWNSIVWKGVCFILSLPPIVNICYSVPVALYNNLFSNILWFVHPHINRSINVSGLDSAVILINVLGVLMPLLYAFFGKRSTRKSLGAAMPTTNSNL